MAFVGEYPLAEKFLRIGRLEAHAGLYRTEFSLIPRLCWIRRRAGVLLFFDGCWLGVGFCTAVLPAVP